MPGLGTALRWHVNIADFTPEKLTKIAIQHAKLKVGCTMTEALPAQLLKHFQEAYDDIGAEGNAHLAHSVIEKADRRREVPNHLP